MPARQDDNRPHLLIIGGGVAGCTLAYELSRHAVRVTVLEAGRIGEQGASSVPVALLNPHRGRTARASKLDLAGLEAMYRVAGELKEEGLESGIHFTGVLRIASNEKQARKWRDLAGTRWLETNEIPAPYHAPFGALLVERGGWLEPEVYLAALVESARRRGVRFLEDCQVERVETSVEGKHFVDASYGDLQADKVIVCAGASQALDLTLPPLERLAGDVIGLSGEARLPYPIAGAVYGAQKSSTVFIGGNHRLEGEHDLDAAVRLQESSGWFVKALKEAPVTSLWTGVRAKRDDNQPLIKELRPGLWFYGALAGRGFLCSSYLSRRLARQLLA